MPTIYQIIQAAKNGDLTLSREHLLADFKGHMVLDIINSPANAKEAGKLGDKDFNNILTSILSMRNNPSDDEDCNIAVENIVNLLVNKILCLSHDGKLQLVGFIYGGNHEGLWMKIENLIHVDDDNYNHSLMLDIKSLIVGGGKLLESIDDGLFKTCNETFNELYDSEPTSINASINEGSAVPSPPPPPPPTTPPPKIIEKDEKSKNYSNVLEQLREAQAKKKQFTNEALDKLEFKKSDAISTVNTSKSLRDQFIEEQAEKKNKKNIINSDGPVESKEIRGLRVHVVMGKNRVAFEKSEIAKITTEIENIKSTIKEMEATIARSQKNLEQKQSNVNKNIDIQKLEDTKEMVENSLRKEKVKLIEAEKKKDNGEEKLERAEKSLETLENKLKVALEALKLSLPKEETSNLNSERSVIT